MYEAGVVATVRASHVMPGMEGPEGELHSHDYRIEVTARRRNLDDRAMVVDIDVLNESLGSALSEIRERNLDQIVPHDPSNGVTVEVLARWVYERIRVRVSDPGVTLAVRVWESPDAFGGYESNSS